MAEFNLENFLRAYVDYAERNIGWGFKSHRATFDGVLEDILEGKYQGCDERIYPESARRMFDIMNAAKVEGKNIQDMLDIYKFITEQVFCPYYENKDGWGARFQEKSYDNYGYLSVFIKRLKDMQDKNPDLVYRALGLLKQSVDYKRPGSQDKDEKKLPLYRDIVTMMASNPKATVDDVKEMIYWAETPEQMEQIINDVFAKVDQSLVDIMSKDVPDAEKIKKLIVYPNGVIMVAQFQGVDRPSPKYDELITNMKQKDPQKYQAWKEKLNNYDKINNEKYNFDKIFSSGDQQYVAHYESLVEKRNVELEQQNGDLKKQNIDLINRNTTLEQEKGALEKSRDQFRDNYDREKLLNKKMEQRYNDERAARLSVEEMLKNALKVIDAYERGNQEIDKAGVFNKGAAKVKMKEEVEKANDELKRAEAEEAKRKAALVARQTAMGEAISI